MTSVHVKTSRYVHILPREFDAIVFNSLTLESFQASRDEVRQLQELFVGSTVSPDDPTVEPLLAAGLVVCADEDTPGEAMARLTQRRREAVQGRPSYFGTMRLSVTERCNMACTYCFQQSLYPEQQPRMNEATLRSTFAWFIEQAAGRPVTVQYFGGEPLLEWSSIILANDLLTQARVQGRIASFRQTMTCNGTLLSEARARVLVDLGFDMTFSFDGPPEENDRARVLKSGRGTYAKAAAGLRNWVAAGGDSALLLTLNPSSVERLPETVRWFLEESELHPRVIGVNSPQPTAAGWETGGSALAKAVIETWDICRDAGVLFHGPGTFIPGHLVSEQGIVDNCVDQTPDEEVSKWPIYVSADGRRSLCLVHHNDHRVEVPFESDSSDGLTELFRAWHHEQPVIEECDSCIASQICGGPCTLERILWKDRLSSDRCGFMQEMTAKLLVK